MLRRVEKHPMLLHYIPKGTNASPAVYEIVRFHNNIENIMYMFNMKRLSGRYLGMRGQLGGDSGSMVQ